MIALAAPALVLAAAAAGDPRPVLVEAQLDNRTEQALAMTEQALATGGEGTAALGLDYLRGHLLDRLGRPHEAAEAFARAMAASPQLEFFSRCRMAAAQERFGHPEVAAGLVATVVSRAPPSPLLDEATRLFVRNLGAGGDCRLLGGIDRSRFAADNRRRLEVAAADCSRAAQPERARELYLKVLREDREDEPALVAAEHLGALAGERPDADVALLLGRAFHWHRRFEQSIVYLQGATASLGANLGGQAFDNVYTLVRGRFWQEDFPAAAAGFADLAGRAGDRGHQALALFQEARAEELAGLRVQAAATYRRAYLADPLAQTADSALAGAMRLEWRGGAEASAEEVYSLLVARRQWIGTAARASLFLAASDLVQGRRDRAGRWLDLAERAGRAVDLEVAYWRGRLAELDGEPAAAVGQYLKVLQRDLFHPLAGGARERLAAPALAAAARAQGRRLAGSDRAEDGYGAWLLLGDGSPVGRAALGRFRGRLAADRLAGPILTVAPVPISSWPLWQTPPQSPEEMLLGLGILGEGAPAVARNFPLADPNLAFTGTALLARGGEFRRAIGRADALRRRGARLPPPLVPLPLRRLLFPFSYSELVVAESLKRRVDPYLLAAILREESLFDPRALSAASARGLAQFVEPTARGLGRRIGLGELGSEDLYRPEISIALAAAHLRELAETFAGAVEPVVASYNAGIPQARLWRDQCFSDEPAEYITKVGFAETRGYLGRVLSSWAEYRDVYLRRGGPGDEP